MVIFFSFHFCSPDLDCMCSITQTCFPEHVYRIFLWTADGNESPSSSPNCCIQLSSSTGINWSSNLALMDGILTFHKIRDTRCSRDNKIQIGLFQRATQSRFCSWVTWQIICQCSFCVLLHLASAQCSNYFILSGQKPARVWL